MLKLINLVRKVPPEDEYKENVEETSEAVAMVYQKFKINYLTLTLRDHLVLDGII